MYLLQIRTKATLRREKTWEEVKNLEDILWTLKALILILQKATKATLLAYFIQIQKISFIFHCCSLFLILFLYLCKIQIGAKVNTVFIILIAFLAAQKHLFPNINQWLLVYNPTKPATNVYWKKFYVHAIIK